MAATPPYRAAASAGWRPGGRGRSGRRRRAAEIAYIDRPHLAKTLRIWRYKGGALTHVADAPDLTNHRFGEPGISGGIRRCTGALPEVITVDANWFRIIASTLRGGAIARRDIGPYTGSASLTRALACR